MTPELPKSPESSRSGRTAPRRKDLLYPELSYRIIGVMMDVHAQLGPNLQEKYYQRGIAKTFEVQGIHFQQQVPVMLRVAGGSIGKYFVDFLVEDKIVVEIKATPHFTMSDFKQVDGYLSSLEKELGILVNFHAKDLMYKRILNADAGNARFGRIRDNS